MHVIFGAGVVGTEAARALVQRGQAVRLVSRARPAALPAGVEHVAADVTDPERARAAARGAEVVYQVLNARYDRWAQDFPGLQAAVVDAARHAGARLVSFENVYMYGKPGPAPFREDHPLAPCSRKGKVRTEMVAALRTSGLTVAHVRASDLFGPGMRLSACGDEVVGRAVAGKAPRFLGDLDAPHTWTYTVDAGEALARVGTDPTAFGQVWHVPSDAPRSANQLAQALSAILGRTITAQRTPLWVVRALGLVVPVVGEMVEMAYEFDAPFVVDDAQTRARLGLSPTPFAEALARTVAWFAAPTGR